MTLLLLGRLLVAPGRVFLPSTTTTATTAATATATRLAALTRRTMAQASVQSARRVAVTQMTATTDKERNFNICADLVERATQCGAQMVFLPEACDFIAESKEESVQLAESLYGPLVAKYRKLAASLKVWLSLGGLHVKEEGEDKISNTHVVIDDRGELAATYVKTHLFSVHIPERNLHLEEKTYVTPGSAVHPPIATPVGEVALAICYDMRFPEMSLMQRSLGAHILTFPSAFTVTTGLAHWEPLLRVRAIETQCYVVAAAQTGQHNKKRSSYGHAMIVDPWGAVISQVSEGTNFAVADINLDYLETIRREMPVQSHRRADLYHTSLLPHHMPGLRVCELVPPPSHYVSYQFGGVRVPGGCVFLKTHLSHAFVNKKPLVPGHVLLTPERPALRLAHLSAAEVSDLAQLTQRTLDVVMDHYRPDSCQVAIQDGPAAGQTIDHVHLHIVPHSAALRKALQGHEGNPERPWREENEMEEEANTLRQVAARVLPALSSPTPQVPRAAVLDWELPRLLPLGPIAVPDAAVVLKTKHSCAFVAPNPILPGHVYVSSLAPCEGLRRAGAAQVVDLFLAAQMVQKCVETHQGAAASTLVMLESACPHQHLQIQIVPRSEDDLPTNDDIYSAVLSHASQAPQWTFTAELAAIASQLRGLVSLM
ncbi:hypothetical protein O3P69_019392 [Scylla paramamosain]|uniref:Nitrilase and fragile histidine triad fusion protein NitFhit n=1 Tax=Scylla paramamosain TaxID=85552 RepID=A0AAW0SVL4_SCYPA